MLTTFAGRPGARNDDRICWIHAGTHKTGTTSIQAFLGENEPALAASGVLIPRTGRVDSALGAHHNVAWQLNGDPRFDAARGGVDALTEELADSGARCACISSEDFELLWNRTDGALTVLRAAIERAGFAPHVVVYLRPQSTYCVSMYAELVRDGYRVDFAEYLGDVVRLGTFRRGPHLGTAFDYPRLLGAFAAAFGAAAVHVRRYRESAADAALPAQFAALVAGRHAARQTYRFPRRLNTAPSSRDVLDALGKDAAAVAPGRRFAPLTAANTLALAARFWPGNVEVAHRFGAFVPPVPLGLDRIAERVRSPLAPLRLHRH